MTVSLHSLPLGRILGVREAYNALDAFGRRFGERPLRLLLHLAVPQSFRAALVNLIKINFVDAGADLGVDAEVLFSPLVEETAGGFHRLDVNVRRHCLMLLDAVYRDQPERRSAQVARFLFAYIENAECQATQIRDPLLAEYLAAHRWVALAFINPAQAVAAFARVLREATDRTEVAARLQLGSVTSAIEIPLAGEQDLLAYARGLDALVSGDFEHGRAIMKLLGDRDLEIGGIRLTAPTRVLSAFAETAAAPDRVIAAQQRRQRNEAQREAEGTRVPKVFISYSHDTVEQQDRVLGLANRLRADGIDAEIDQYNTAPAEGWPLWCERQIAAADVVLMVCTETYHRRVSGDEEQGKGLGVVWEARIIRQLLYDAGAISDKFVPVLFSDASPEQIPTPIKGWARYVVDTEDGYKELYRRLTGQPRLLRPALETIRPLPPRRRQWPGGTIFISYRRDPDAGFARRLFDRLERTFRRKVLFMDVDSIAPGQDFVSILEARVAQCDVLLALIGRGWLTATDEADRRRLDNPEDFVRIEIAAALTQAKHVIPVLIDDVPMPRAEDLPEVLKPLVRRQATRLSHDRFKADSDRLIRELKEDLADAEARQAAELPGFSGGNASLASKNYFIRFIENSEEVWPLLPLVHITNAYKLGTIIDAGAISTEICQVHKENICYLFYGKPPYHLRNKKQLATKVLGDAAVCFLIKPTSVRLFRLFAINTGAFFGGMYDDFMPNGMSVEDFEMPPRLPFLAKFVGAFFGSNRAYHNSELSSMLDISGLDHVSESFISLATTHTSDTYDERLLSCEVQTDMDIPLNSETLTSMVIPHQLADDKEVMNACMLWGIKPILYNFRRSIPESRLAVIYEKLSNFYERHGYF